MTLTDGVKKLRAFLEKNGISKRKAARDLFVSLPTVIDWLRGTKTPTLAHRRAISVWTKGEVAELDWESRKERDAVRKTEKVEPFEPTGTGGGE